MESGDHTHTDKFVSSLAEHSKLQHAELGLSENLHKSEQLGFAGDQHIEHRPEDFVFGGGVRKDKHVPSASDINQFIFHESRTNIPTEGLLPAHTNLEQPSEEGTNEGLSATERNDSASVVSGGGFEANGPNPTSSRTDVAGDGQTVTEAKSEGKHENSISSTSTLSKDESITSQDRRSDSVLKDESVKNSDETHLQTDLDVLKETTKISKTDAEDLNLNINSNTLSENSELRSGDQLSNSNGANENTVGLGREVKSDSENVQGKSQDSNNSFICNEKSEIQTKTESDKISETEKHEQFLLHEGDEKDPAEKKQQKVSEDTHSNFIQSEKGGTVEERRETESTGITEKTQFGETQEDLQLNTSDKPEESNENTDQKPSEPPLSKDEPEDEWLDILGSGHLKKKVVKKAENEYRPQNLHICEINLEGRLEDGTVVEKYENLKIQIGDVEVVQGIDLALPLMNVGEVALLDVGPRFAYGSLGRAPDIPPDAKLMYTIELLSAEDEPDLESLSIAQRKEIGHKKRERGNWWFARQEYSFAIQSYRRAIEFLDEAEGGFSIEKKEISEDAEKQLQELLEDRLKVFNNLAAAQMKIKAYDAALTSVENVLRCQPQNVKALFRKGKILAAKGDTTGALSMLRNASQLEPESKAIKQEVQRLLDIIKHDTKQEKSLYKKMLGQSKSTEKTSSKGSKISYRTWGIVCSSVAVVLLGAVAYRYKFL